MKHMRCLTKPSHALVRQGPFLNVLELLLQFVMKQLQEQKEEPPAE